MFSKPYRRILAVFMSCFIFFTFSVPVSWAATAPDWGNWNFPIGITKDSAGRVIVADYSAQVVRIFNSNESLSQILGMVNGNGTDNTQFNGPISVAVHPVTKSLYVLDRENRRIQIYGYQDATGLYTYSSTIPLISGIGNDRSLSIDSSGTLFVAQDSGILIIYPNQTMQTIAGSSVLGAAGDGSGTLYVTRYWEHTVAKYSLVGGSYVFQSIFAGVAGESGNDDAHLQNPEYVFVGPDKKVYVTDSERTRVFLPDGSLAMSLKPTNNYSPGAVFADGNEILVLDTQSRGVYQYSISGDLIGRLGEMTPPPAITGQPSSATIAAGGNTTFSVTASNATGYQWQVDTGAGFTNISNGAPYSGATTATLTITGATAGMNGYAYRAIVSGLTTPSATSNIATLTITSSPAITGQPSSATIAPGGNTTFSVTASNATGYQWQVDTGAGFTNISNGAPYSGATTATLTITGATAGMNGYAYRVIASGLAGPSATSNSATLTITPPPAITGQPSSATIAPGGNTTFSVMASNATGYQWQVDTGAGFTNITNGAPYSGATTATLVITGATAGMNGYAYRAIVSGLAAPNATSNGATLTVKSPSTPSTVTPPYIPSSNTELKSLTLSFGEGKSLTLTPAFRADVFTYETNTDASQIVIGTATDHDAAKTTYRLNGQVVPAGINADLNLGKNELLIQVQAENGTTQTYTVNIIRNSVETTYPDTKGHWAEQKIGQAARLKIVSGYEDGSFAPDKSVTRAEFLVMLMNALKPQTDGAALAFSDEGNIGGWARNAVAQALQAGIVTGYGDGTFRPNAEIIRSEMAVMIAKALGLSTSATTGDNSFVDERDIPYWAQGAVAGLKQLGVVEGKGANTFDPAGLLTRAEAVTVILNMLTQLDK